MPVSMHSTVPDRVRAIASSHEELEKLAAGQPEIGSRLVSESYQDMGPVWTRICGFNDPRLPVRFFEYAVSLPSRWHRLNKTTTTEIAARLAAAAADADDLANELKELQDEIAFYRGQPLTITHVSVRAETILSELAGEVSAPKHHWQFGATEAQRNPRLTISEYLLALGAELRSAPSNNVRIRPTKIADKNAQRTFMVKSLASFLNGGLGDPCYDIVATTVNTILDSKDGGLDANHARKLADGLF